jgi:hypothetical protein
MTTALDPDEQDRGEDALAAWLDVEKREIFRTFLALRESLSMCRREPVVRRWATRRLTTSAAG